MCVPCDAAEPLDVPINQPAAVDWPQKYDADMVSLGTAGPQGSAGERHKLFLSHTHRLTSTNKSHKVAAKSISASLNQQHFVIGLYRLFSANNILSSTLQCHISSWTYFWGWSLTR